MPAPPSIALSTFLQAALHEQQEDDLAYYDALEDLGDGYESYPESEEDAEDPEQVSVVGVLLSVGRLCPCRQLCGMRSSAFVCTPVCTEGRTWLFPAPARRLHSFA